MSDQSPLTGSCACGEVKYQINQSPLSVHCCHCFACQRESGSAFALNALVESCEVELLNGQLDRVELSTPSGKGQSVLRCPSCRVAVWSHYLGLGESISFIRVGSLDNPHQVPASIHIYTDSKQPWVTLPSDVPAVPRFYKFVDQWPDDKLARLSQALKKT